MFVNLFYMLFFINKICKNIRSFHFIELWWSLLPVLILIIITLPSFKILYISELDYLPIGTVKVIRNQWYWTYEYNDFNTSQLDSFIKTNYIPYEFRLLETDNYLLLSCLTSYRCLITSSDVIHRFSLPSINIKVDSNPNLVNSVLLYSLVPGLFYGECSEICGINHRIIPIKVEICLPRIL